MKKLASNYSIISTVGAINVFNIDSSFFRASQKENKVVTLTFQIDGKLITKQFKVRRVHDYVSIRLTVQL